MKTYLALVLAIAACPADAICFSLYNASGQLVYQSQQAPFDISSESPELAQQEARGLRLVIAPSETCGGNDYAERKAAALRYVQSGQRSADTGIGAAFPNGGFTGGAGNSASPGYDPWAANRAAAAQLEGVRDRMRQSYDNGRVIDAIDGLRRDLR